MNKYIFLVMALAATPAHADDLQANIGGFTQHFKPRTRGDWQDVNNTLGLTYDYAAGKHTYLVATGDWFRNSLNRQSWYGGIGGKACTASKVDFCAGATGGLVSGYPNHKLALYPFVEASYQRVSVRAICVPNSGLVQSGFCQVGFSWRVAKW